MALTLSGSRPPLRLQLSVLAVPAEAAELAGAAAFVDGAAFVDAAALAGAVEAALVGVANGLALDLAAGFRVDGGDAVANLRIEPLPCPPAALALAVGPDRPSASLSWLAWGCE